MTDQTVGNSISGLYAPRGRTRSEVGAVGLPIFAGYLSLDPNAALRGVQGVNAYRTMRDDEPAASALWHAVSNLLRTDLYVEPGGTTENDKRAAEFLEQCLDDMRDTPAAYLRQMQSFLWAGWGIHELVYKRRGGRGSRYADGRVGWAAWALRRQASLYRWGYDTRNGRIVAFSQRPAPTYTLRVIPIQKCIHLVADESEGSPEGRSIFRPMYRGWYFVKNFELLSGISLERFGTGLPVFEIDGEVVKVLSADDKATLETIAGNLRQNEQAYVITPPGIKFRMEESPGLNAESYFSAIDKFRTWMLSTALAEFIALGTGSSGSFALGKDKSELFLEALNGYQERMLSPLNRSAVPRLLKYNDFGPLTDYPRLRLPSVRRYDLTTVGDFVAQMVSGGGLHLTPEDEAWLRRIANMPEASAAQADQADAETPSEEGEEASEGIEEAEGAAPVDRVARVRGDDVEGTEEEEVVGDE